MPVKSPSEPAGTKGFNLFVHDLTISYLAQAAGLEPTTHGFGDRRSTHIELRLYMLLLEKGAFLFFRGIFETYRTKFITADMNTNSMDIPPHPPYKKDIIAPHTRHKSSGESQA